MIFRRFALAFAFALAACSPGGGERPPLEGARLGGPFTLTSHEGQTVTEADFAGRYRLVYFGFTHCPDVCPTDLQAIGQGLRRFEQAQPRRAERVQPIMITVDPERDTPEAMAQYVSAFHPRLIGLTGTPEQIRDVARAHGVYYAAEQPTAPGVYNVNHAQMAVLYGPEGQPIAILPHESPERVAAELDRWVR